MVSVTFDDQCVKFTLEERSLLNPSEKKLYRDVMVDTFKNMALVEKSEEDQTTEVVYKNPRRILRRLVVGRL
jgi:KRAB domain-containing zinc finger protein|uniref:KRAB domain-containing protein n=1 Tax=Castor canadensis TaxID=51338 RepID=A0A8C0WWG3_CASCN